VPQPTYLFNKGGRAKVEEVEKVEEPVPDLLPEVLRPLRRRHILTTASSGTTWEPRVRGSWPPK
jgi:hypothetical protein